MTSNPSHQPSLRDPATDEIELIDIFRVIWKWKYLILTGTLVCALVAGVLSFVMPEFYSVDMVLRPGILKVKEDGSNTYIDSPENIKALIDAGTFEKEILNEVANSEDRNLPDGRDMPKSLDFKTDIPRDSNTLKISYETADINLGKEILQHLKSSLIEKYKKLVDYYQKEYETKISLKKAEIENHRAAVKAAEQNIKNFQERIAELKERFRASMRIL